MNLFIEKLNYERKDDPSDLFTFCLDNQLYKKEEGDFLSRMKKVYSQAEPCEGISTTIAYIDDNPIGICLLEHRLNEKDELFHHQAGIMHFDNRERKNPWKKKLDFHFIHMGFISFYVKEEYRNQGIAQDLLSAMEKIQLERLSNAQLPADIVNNMNENYLVVTAREKAESVVNKSILFHPLLCDTHQGNYKKNISSLSYRIFYGEMTDKKLGDMLNKVECHHQKVKP